MIDRVAQSIAVTASAFVCATFALAASQDHLIPESGAFTAPSPDHEVKVRHLLVDRVIESHPIFYVVVDPNFAPQWVLAGDEGSSMLRVVRANVNIFRARASDVDVVTDSKRLPVELLRRMTDVLLVHLSSARSEPQRIERSNPKSPSVITARFDATDYHFVSMGLSGKVWVEGPAVGSLKKLVDAAEKFVRATAADNERVLGKFRDALDEAEQELRSID